MPNNKSNESRVNNPKSKLAQLFCRHKADWYRKEDTFRMLNGERHYLICEKCGKIMDTRFIPYD